MQLSLWTFKKLNGGKTSCPLNAWIKDQACGTVLGKRTMFSCCPIRSWCQPSSRQIWLHTALYWTTCCLSVLLTFCWLPKISRHFYSVFLAGSLNRGGYVINSIKRKGAQGTQGLYLLKPGKNSEMILVSWWCWNKIEEWTSGATARFGFLHIYYAELVLPSFSHSIP